MNDGKQTCNMTHPNEKISQAMVRFGIKSSTSPRTGYGGTSSGARHRIAPPAVEDQYEVPSNSALNEERPKSIRHARRLSSMRTFACLINQ